MAVQVLGNASMEIDVTPLPKVLALLENLNVEPWACIAELCDNALDDFRVNNTSAGKIKIEVDGNQLTITDNGSGMSVGKVQNAISAGFSEKGKSDELGLFGVGFNVGTVGLGRRSTLTTKTVNEKHWTHVDIDINKMIKAQSFKLRAERARVPGEMRHGTIVTIDLDDQHVNQFNRPAFQKTISENLGQAYSYILRESVPGLTGGATGNPRDVEITLEGAPVLPWIPCIWDEGRNVQYRGSAVEAVQKFDRALPDASICNDCGYWHMTVNANECERCGSNLLEVKQRRVWGWVGVQRYMDRIEFGINFIRNGRTILFRDKTIFTYTDPTTGEVNQEYPVEWPADQGRIVGELHCDHVGVDFIKSSFDVNDSNWRGAISILHGDAWLQPTKNRGKSLNDSPLAQIFNAYRINEPGLRYLVPGNGERAIHQATKNWARKFQGYEPTYISDKEWYEAAENHDRIKSGATSGATETGATIGPTGLGPTGLSSQPIQGNVKSGGGETDLQKMKRWEAGGTKRQDLTKSVTPLSVKKTYALEVWETQSQVLDALGAHLAVHAIPVKGNEIHIFAESQNPVFTKYGRNTTDLILMEAAAQIKSLANAPVPASLIYAELLSEFPDEEKSESVLRSRIAELEARLKPRIHPVVASSPSKFWKSLSKDSKEAAEGNAMATETPVLWKDAITSGNFASYLTLKGMNELFESHPSDFLDGKVFKQMYATVHAQQARQRTHGYLTKAVQDLVNISGISGALNPYEVNVAEHSLDFVNKNLPDHL